MTNGRNFVAGVASSGWTALVGLLAVPWYIQYLGIEAYGMIGVHLTLQGMFVLLDMGLSPTVSREVARASVNGNMPYARTLVHSMSVVFVLTGCIVAAGVASLAPWLARNWLNSGSLPIEQVILALALSAVAIGLRWPATLYVGVLNGTRRIDLASAVTITTTTLASLGAVMVLVFVEPTLRAFFLWQALVGAIHSLLMRAAARRALGAELASRFEWTAISSIWRFSAGMAAVSATGILFSQIDKLVLMRTTTLDEVGHYTIATALAGILYRLVTPAFNVVYPQFSALVETGSSDDLSRQYHHSTRLFLTVIFPVAMALLICARPILSIWLDDGQLVSQTAILVKLLTLGTAIHCVMYFPYALQISHGETLLPMRINIALSVVFFPAVFVLSTSMGAIGAAIAWVFLHVCYFTIGTWLTHRRLLPGETWRWVLHAVAPPLVISGGFGFAAAAIMLVVETDVARLLVGMVFTLAALTIGALLLPEGRVMLRRATVGLT
jgi:O-antigen/teichoic acid export membrane protein